MTGAVQRNIMGLQGRHSLLVSFTKTKAHCVNHINISTVCTLEFVGTNTDKEHNLET